MTGTPPSKENIASLRVGTVLPNQVDNHLQDQVFLRGVLRGVKPGWKCLCDKSANILVNATPAASFDVVIYNLFSDIFYCIRLASGGYENAIQNHGEIYDIAHHATNTLLAGVR